MPSLNSKMRKQHQQLPAKLQHLICSLPMEHDPLSSSRNAVMALIERRQTRQHRVVVVRHAIEAIDKLVDVKNVLSVSKTFVCNFFWFFEEWKNSQGDRTEGCSRKQICTVSSCRTNLVLLMTRICYCKNEVRKISRRREQRESARSSHSHFKLSETWRPRPRTSGQEKAESGFMLKSAIIEY